MASKKQAVARGMTVSRPRISIILCNYNHARYLPDALEAITTQSQPPDEFIVVDDGSTDDSWDVISSYAKRFPFIKNHRNERNRGVVYSANRAFELSTGEYVHWAAADDRMLPGFIRYSTEALTKYPHAGLCCSIPTFFTDSLTNLHYSKTTTVLEGETSYISPKALAPIISSSNFWIAGHTTLFRRSSIANAGHYHYNLKWHCDWFALYVIAARSGICYVDRPLAAMRISDTAYSSSGRSDWKEQRKVIIEAFKLLESPIYKDVRWFFRDGAVLRFLRGQGIFRHVAGVALTSPRWFRYFFWVVTPKIVKSKMKRALTLLLRAVISRSFFSRLSG